MKPPIRSSLVVLGAFAAGAVVTATLADVRKKPVPELRPAEPAAIQARSAQDGSAGFERPAPNPVPARTPVIAPTTVAPSPAADDERQADTATVVEEVQQLRDEVGRLKEELGRTRADSQTAVLLDVDRHVAGIRAQLAENQAWHEEESGVAHTAAAQRHEAVQILFAANRRLGAGDYDVVDSLDAASPALPYPAQTALRNARERLQAEDLYAARYWISVAIVESGWSQITQ